MRAAPLALLAAALTGFTAQDPQPIFRSAVDVVTVDVSVLDRAGRPAPGLTGQDFSLLVDGKPRAVTSAQFISVAAAGDAIPDRTDRYSTNRESAGARLIMLAIDGENIGAARGRQAAEAARRFIRTLSPVDRVALVTLPTGNPGVDFTSRHEIVEAALARSVAPPGDRATPPRIGLAEALAVERNDTNGIRGLLDRECAADPSPQGRDACLQQLTQEAETLVNDTRRRTMTSLSALRAVFDRLAATPAPKTLILVSEGFLLDGDRTNVAWVGSRAASAHTTIYALQVDPPDADAATPTGRVSRGEDREILRDGLEAVASLARGDVYRVAASADPVFDRLSQELSGYYLLGFDPQPADRDGRPHRIRVDVRRTDLTVRSRREFMTPPPAAAATDVNAALLETLKSPLPATGIPLALATYTLKDSASGQLKVIVAAQIDRSADTRARTSLAYALIDGAGKVVANQVENSIDTPIDLRTKQQKYIGSARAPAGSYTVRLAVVDDGGRRGSVERPFTAALHTLGGIQFTDLLIADNSEAVGATGLMPTVTADFTGSELHVFIEAFSTPATLPPDLAIAFEVSTTGDKPTTVTRSVGRLQHVPDDPGHASADATLRIQRLLPGDYVAKTTISDGGRRLGTVERPFSVVPAPTRPQG